jgi:hydroxyacylglutathione hydrolase
MRIAWLLVVAACGGNETIPGTPGDGSNPADDAPVTPTDGPTGGLVPGSLAVTWMHGSANCNQNADPEVQVHAYNPTTHILRQNKCDTFEAPFIYVLAGTQKALVLDTGATNSTTLRTTVRGLIGTLPLTVAHSHAHGDHVAGDSTFAGQPNTTVVGTSVSAVQAAFGIANFTTDVGSIDLGDRVLDVLGVPGHQASHIALYDRQTGLLLTGDSLYPGFLFVSDWTTYRASMKRLAGFAAARPIAHVLGAHVEMTSTPGQGYPYGTVFQPAEHVLQLTAANLVELDAALDAAGATPPNNDIVKNDFIISPQ